MDPEAALRVGAHLSTLRQRRGISLSAAAMAMGWNFRRMRAIELGQRSPRYAEVMALLDLYESGWPELRALEDDIDEG